MGSRFKLNFRAIIAQNASLVRNNLRTFIKIIPPPNPARAIHKLCSTIAHQPNTTTTTSATVTVGRSSQKHGHSPICEQDSFDSPAGHHNNVVFFPRKVGKSCARLTVNSGKLVQSLDREGGGQCCGSTKIKIIKQIVCWYFQWNTFFFSLDDNQFVWFGNVCTSFGDSLIGDLMNERELWI